MSDDKCSPVTAVVGGDGFNDGDTDKDGLLDVSEVWTYECTTTIAAHLDGEEDPVENTATATGTDLDGDAVTPGQHTHATDILHREGTLSLLKAGPTSASHGDSVTYLYDVTYWSAVSS